VKKTGISAITGKTVVIRHATEWDMVFTEENLKKNDLDTTGLQAYQFAVAAEKSDLIGFGGLRKTGDVYDIGCVVVAEKRRNRGAGTAIVKHLIEYSPQTRSTLRPTS
jgi:N-acetylglutamate synthase-like GNAT family acetyltransferase